MEHLINSIGSGASWLSLTHSLFGIFNVFGLPSLTLSIAVIFSGAGLAILNRFTGNVGFATLPLNYFALLFGALSANWILKDVRTPFEPTLQAPIIFGIAGMTASALLMMLVLRRQ
jgi:hypothetical protein